jgi:hypothetical protein
MRSAGNFHPQWGYLAPAPSFLRSARVVIVATAVGATAGAAVVVSLLQQPGADADNSLAAHALVTSAPVAATAPPVSAPAAAAPASKSAVARAGPATPQPAQSQPAPPPKQVLVNADAAAAVNAQPAPPPLPAATAESKPAEPAKRSAGRRHRTASNERHWQAENGFRKRRWFRFRLFSFRGLGSSSN